MHKIASVWGGTENGCASRQNCISDGRVTGNWSRHRISTRASRGTCSGSLRPFHPGCGVVGRRHPRKWGTRRSDQGGLGNVKRGKTSGGEDLLVLLGWSGW